MLYMVLGTPLASLPTVNLPRVCCLLTQAVPRATLTSTSLFALSLTVLTVIRRHALALLRGVRCPLRRGFWRRAGGRGDDG